MAVHVSLCVLALLLERVAEIRVGDTWRNVAAQLDTMKLVQRGQAGARIQQTTELRPAVVDLLTTLQIQPPPKFHYVTTAWTAE